jgi:TRAP transporter TAXI family solute receptor
MRKTFLRVMFGLMLLLPVHLGLGSLQAMEKSILVTAGGVGGSWFIAGAAFTDVWGKSVPDLKTQLIPGGGSSNPIRVNKGEADIGFTYATNAISAVKGEEPYKGKMGNLRGMANLQILQYLALAVLRNTGLTSYEQIREKKFPLKICPGTRGLGGELTFRRVIEEYGFSYQDIVKWGGKVYFAGWTESVSEIRDGRANALTSQTVLQNPFMVELSTSRDMKYIPMGEKAVKRLVSKFGYSRAVVPKGAYKGMDDDYLTVADSVVLVCKKDLSEELVYRLVKLLCENEKRWKATHVMFKEFKAQETAQLPENFVLHPGAAKYFREKGYLK